MEQKIKWEKPMLRSLGIARLSFVHGVENVCDDGLSALVECISGTGAGAPASCSYGIGVTQ